MSELLFTEFIESLIKVTVLPTSVRLSDGAIADLFLMTAARRAVLSMAILNPLSAKGLSLSARMDSSKALEESCKFRNY